MDNYILKSMLGNEYTKNPIINFLLYKEKGKYVLPTPKSLFNKKYEELTYNEKQKYYKEYGEWRKKYDFDVICKEGDLNADSIFSIWLPLKMCLQSSNTYSYSNHGNGEKPYESYPYIPNIIKNIEIYLPYSDWQELYEFITLAFTNANVMRLPDRKMQKRGELYYDQMPKTLYECFNDGKFNEYFKDIKVEDWVKSEQLLMFFNDNKVSRNTIKPLISKMRACEFAWLENPNEIKEMLINFNKILKQRTNS